MLAVRHTLPVPSKNIKMSNVSPKKSINKYNLCEGIDFVFYLVVYCSHIFDVTRNRAISLLKHERPHLQGVPQLDQFVVCASSTSGVMGGAGGGLWHQQRRPLVSCGCSISSEIHTGGVDHDVQGGAMSRTSADSSIAARDAAVNICSPWSSKWTISSSHLAQMANI